MNDATVIDLAAKAIVLTAELSAPILAVTLTVGLGVSLLQSVTQVQEVTLTFVPKLAAVAVVILLSGNWMLSELVGFTESLMDQVPALVGKA